MSNDTCPIFGPKLTLQPKKVESPFEKIVDRYASINLKAETAINQMTAPIKVMEIMPATRIIIIDADESYRKDLGELLNNKNFTVIGSFHNWRFIESTLPTTPDVSILEFVNAKNQSYYGSIGTSTPDFGICSRAANKNKN